MPKETVPELFNHIPVPSLIVGLFDSVILDANKAACRFYHISREELVGTLYCSLCADKNDFQSEMKITTLDKINNSYKCVHKTRTGHIRDVIVHSECIRYHGQDASCLIIIDITERVKNSKYLHMFNKCLLEFSESPEGNIQSLTKLCGSMLGWTAALYSRIDNGQLCAVGAWNTPNDFNRTTSPIGHICHDVILDRGKKQLLTLKIFAKQNTF